MTKFLIVTFFLSYKSVQEFPKSLRSKMFTKNVLDDLSNEKILFSNRHNKVLNILKYEFSI